MLQNTRYWHLNNIALNLSILSNYRTDIFLSIDNTIHSAILLSWADRRMICQRAVNQLCIARNKISIDNALQHSFTKHDSTQPTHKAVEVTPGRIVCRKTNNGFSARLDKPGCDIQMLEASTFGLLPMKRIVASRPMSCNHLFRLNANMTTCRNEALAAKTFPRYLPPWRSDSCFLQSDFNVCTSVHIQKRSFRFPA